VKTTGVSEGSGACLTVEVLQAVRKTSADAISRQPVHATRITRSFGANDVTAAIVPSKE
jgi:hypothetical protein